MLVTCRLVRCHFKWASEYNTNSVAAWILQRFSGCILGVSTMQGVAAHGPMLGDFIEIRSRQRKDSLWSQGLDFMFMALL